MSTIAVWGPADAALPSSNAPAPGVDGQTRRYLAFDASTDQTCYFDGIAAQGITGTLTLIITYRMTSATTGTARWEALVEAISDGDAVDTDSASSFDSTNSNGATVPGTAGHIDQISITLTNADSIAAGDYFRILLRRDADGTTGTDSATGNSEVLEVELRDAA